MAKSIKKLLKSFTLIELIIVIAIIAVLGASAFLVLSQWMSKSRDSRKIADLGTIDTAINVSITSNDKLPTPDNKADITFANSKIWEVGYFGDVAVKQMGGTLTKSPTDPTTKEWYRYAQWNNTKYQLGTIIENEQFSRFANRVYANEYFTRLQGNYHQTIIIAKVGSDDVIIPAPSLIIDEFSEGTQELDEEHFWTNKNSYNLGGEQTNKIQVQTLFSGDISTLKDSDVFNAFKVKFADTFSGSVYMKEFTPDLSQEKIEAIVNTELQKVGTQTVSVQYLSCDATVHGQTKIFFKENNVIFGQACDSQQKEFKCENGVWKDGANNADLDTYKYSTCTVGPANNCVATTNTQKSTTNLDLIFDIPDLEHGLGFSVDSTVNENSSKYKYTLVGVCNNGLLENIVFGSPVLDSCIEGTILVSGECKVGLIGDNTVGRKWSDGSYASSCKNYLNPESGKNYVGATGNGAYNIQLKVGDIRKVYCDMTSDGGGWTVLFSSAAYTLNPNLLKAMYSGSVANIDSSGIYGGPVNGNNYYTILQNNSTQLKFSITRNNTTTYGSLGFLAYNSANTSHWAGVIDSWGDNIYKYSKDLITVATCSTSYVASTCKSVNSKTGTYTNLTTTFPYSQYPYFQLWLGYTNAGDRITLLMMR